MLDTGCEAEIKSRCVGGCTVGGGAVWAGSTVQIARSALLIVCDTSGREANPDLNQWEGEGLGRDGVVWCVSRLQISAV